jgi:hypothetical protein
VAAVLCVASCDGAGGTTSANLGTTTIAEADAIWPSPGSDPLEALERWLDRSDGQIATYTAEIGCSLCIFGGTYALTELDGELIEIVPIDGHEGFAYPEQWTLTAVLRQAAALEGDFSIFESEDSLTIDADPSPGAVVDDEWQYSATKIRLTEPTEIALAGSWKWLDVYGSEPPPPVVPEGWQILDVVGLRFAVPRVWTAPLPESCAEPSPGVVLVQLTDRVDAVCSPSEMPPPSLIVERARYAEPAERVVVGDVQAHRPMSADCTTCAIYQFDDGLQVSVRGDRSDAILSTFTTSGARRVLQQGETVDSASWQMLEYEGVAFTVPSDWTVRDLAASDQQSSESGNGILGDPGTCGGGLFTSAHSRQVFLAISPFQPPCPPAASLDLTPNEAIWIRPADGSEVPATSGFVNGLDISVLYSDWFDRRQPDRTAELLVRTGDRALRVSLGVGVNTAAARTILRSLHQTPVLSAAESGTRQPEPPTGVVPHAPTATA